MFAAIDGPAHADCAGNNGFFFHIAERFYDFPNGLFSCGKRTGTMLLHLPTCLCESRPGRVFLRNAEKGWSMEKWLCWGSLGVAGILLLLFLLDMLLAPYGYGPFGGISWIVNIIGVLACGLTGYLAWESFKELR